MLRHSCVLIVLVFLAMVFPGRAQIVTLTADSGVTAQINSASQAGMYNWNVGGVTQLNQQWFWYRIGTVGPESSVDTISAAAINQTTTNQATITYNNASLNVQLTYVLTGNTASSGLNESVRLINNTASSLDLHFFQYSDFDLNNTTGGQSVSLSNSTVRATQTYSLGPAWVATETATPNANHREAAFYNTTLASLNDVNPTTLNDNLTAGPGDVTFAYEWDFTIAAGGSKLISKIVNVSVPEPSAIALMVLGLAAITLRRAKARESTRTVSGDNTPN